MSMRLMTRYLVADITTDVITEEIISLINTKTMTIIIIETIIVTIVILEIIVITILRTTITAEIWRVSIV